VPDDIRDEAVAVVVVATAPDALGADDLIAFCAGRLSKFKVPTLVRFTDELPKTSIGKIRKEELRRALAPGGELSASADR
jgi:carnitine-CoA ligase